MIEKIEVDSNRFSRKEFGSFMQLAIKQLEYVNSVKRWF